MLHDKMDFPNMKTTEIITFNTIKLRKAIRVFGKGLGIPLDSVNEICAAIHIVSEEENKREVIDESWYKKYPELFKWVDLTQGICESVGAHASGVVAATVDLESEIGTCYLAGDDYPVSAINMKELDSLNFVKEDVLGLTNISCINKTCKMAGIPKLSAKTIDVNDDKVWESVRNDTSLIFEVNSPYGERTVSQMYSPKVWNKIKKSNPSITKFDLMAYISALIRPCGKEVYSKAIQGEGYVSGVKDIDDLLSSEMGYPIMQESQMSFVQKFCGYTFLQADKLRKCVTWDTKVTMGDYTQKNIEDIEIGDMVLSYKNGFAVKSPVVNKFNNGVKNTVKVILDNGQFVKCTPDHKILVRRYNEYDPGNGWYMEAKDLTNEYTVFAPSGYGDFYPERVSCVKPYKNEVVYDIEVEETHNFVANNIVAHNCVAKKLGTKDQLPIIRKAFEENAKIKYNLSDEKTDEIMDVFLNCILYATRYSFSSIHSYSYAYISYECAWLRYYYPMEFLSCCLNEWQGNPKRTIEATTYAQKNKIKILSPKFRHSKAEYFPDKSTNSIYKGIGSIKFMSQSCADNLYNLRDNHYAFFVDLLKDIYEKKAADNRQLDILIKLDFFEEFGNPKELLRLVKMYDMFGKASKIKKEKLSNSDIVRAIVERHSVGVNKDGKESKTYSQLDNVAILHECETLIMSLGIKPFTIKEKAEVQKEYMGYIDIATGKQEDRPKLYILDIKTLKSKTTGRTWARQITAQSIGSGKQSNYTITSKYYHEEIQAGDVILCKHLEKQKDYWHITDYEVMLDV